MVIRGGAEAIPPCRMTPAVALTAQRCLRRDRLPCYSESLLPFPSCRWDL